ncbi:HAD-IC family P-type ATPase [Actinomadura parmotrematis]|uniref:Cation-translocating P-type ATPase n=1 Tax=Actinomadura parmotrematis TaxID=2864039 RepID=A0ABS7FZA5_9ACTN|nr:HAD-IC family P-type ATPase [Actinomadura parmotrematis]MBW8485777.1 cation-translocating P-type ATPase [Actinomadura parmotrematis]
METTAARGLTAAEVRERVAAGQANDVPRRSSRSVGEIVRANVLTRFNALIGTLFVLVLAFGQWQDGLFGGIIVANSAIGVIQELRAKRTLDRLAVIGETPVTVRRDGAEETVAQHEVVLGDLIVLGTGDRIPVDGAVASARGLEVDESLLTGEADPVHKAPGDQVQSGSFVVAGGGAFTAEKVGRDAYAARLVEEASRFTLARSELMSGIDRFLKWITWLIVPTAVLLFVSQWNSAGSVPAAVVGAVAGVVTMIPEGLVLMTSIAFAVGVVRLGRRRCLVQELPAIEGLARVDVLCVDKTGTLTEPGMDLDRVVALSDALPGRAALAALAAGDDDPNATMRAVQEGLGEPDPHWTITGTVPFSSARKWSGAAFDGHGSWAFGAADVLLGPADPARAEAERLGSTGLRVLALARVPDGSFADPDGLDATASAEPAALVVLRQRVRPDAAETLRYFADQDVTVKVISGDNPVSVGAIAADLGLPGASHPVDARTLPDGAGAMGEVLEANSVFGRVSPQQKRAMVKALQSRGHTVAMTGDGVNDVLALKDADLGISMGSGSGATRAVAQIVLLDNRFATLPHVVGEGRRVLGNIERVANLFLTKTVYSILLSVLVGLVGVRFPFLPRHLTLISSLTIGIPAFFLALAPNTERARAGFVPRVLRFAVPAGIACGAATFAGYRLATENPATGFEDDSTTASLALFVLALWVLLLIARPWNWWRLSLVAAMAAAFLVVLAVPWLRDFFALHPDNLQNDLTALAIAVGASVLLTLSLRWDTWYQRFRRPRKPEAETTDPQR